MMIWILGTSVLHAAVVYCSDFYNWFLQRFY